MDFNVLHQNKFMFFKKLYIYLEGQVRDRHTEKHTHIHTCARAQTHIEGRRERVHKSFHQLGHPPRNCKSQV